MPDDEYFRGGKSLKPCPGETKRDPATGLLKTTHGISVWNRPDGLGFARRLVEEFIANWDEHRAVLRTRNLAAQEGDERFRAVRNDSLRPLTEGIGAKVAARQDSGLVPYAAGAAMVSMLERMAAFHADLEAYGTSRVDVVETTARILHHTATGQ